MELMIIDLTSDEVFNFWFSIPITISFIAGGFIGAISLLKSRF